MTAARLLADAAAPTAPPHGTTSGAAAEALHTAGQMITDTAAQTPPLPAENLFSWGGYFQALIIMGILLILLWAALWALRRFGKFRFLPIPGALPRDALRMEAQLPLGPKKGLMVVRFLDRRLLLGVTEHQITLLKDMGLHDDQDSKESFERLLQGDDVDKDSTEEHPTATPQPRE